MDDQSDLKTKIDDDGLSARLIMPEGFDRTMLSPGMCDAALLRAGIEINEQTKRLIEEYIGKSATATPGVFSAVIAKGTPPRHGEDGYIEWTIDQPAEPGPDAKQAAEEPTETDTDGQVSFYERSAFIVVRSGDVLGTVHRPTTGEDGRSVTGKTLAAREGRETIFTHDESIMVDSRGRIIAQMDGVLDRRDNKACISDTLEIKRYVDFETGNVAFNGSVIVHKGVRDRFKVEAGGDVEVRGLIEAASIHAGGNLHALGGFAGREQGETHVTGDLHAKYLDAVKIKVRGDLMVDREMINCHATVLGNIASPRGSIIGGTTRVAGAVDIAELGADGLPLTTLVIGGVPHLDPLIRDLGRLTEQLIEQRQKLLDEQDLIQRAAGKRIMAGHKERLCELMYEVAEIQNHLDRSEPSLAKARERAETMRRCEVKVQKKVFPNTVLECAGLRYRIKNELKGPLQISVDGRGQLQVQYDGAKPGMLARSADLSEAA